MGEKREQIYRLKRTARFQGERRIGLDTNILVDLIENPRFFSNEGDQILGDTAFVHRISLEPDKEATHILQKKGRSLKEATQELTEFLKNNKIQVIERDSTNRETVRELFNLCKKNNIEMHPPDCYIIADFKKERINLVYSTNNHFKQACKLMGMGVGEFPTMDKKIKDFFRQTYGRRSKTRRR
ncbi:MAG: PIN domain-containing protein [Candidatus Altiarchaeota archaeon]